MSQHAIQDDMPRPPTNSVQIAIRVPAEWHAEADEIAALISRPGFQASRTDAFRAAIAKGFEALREEYGVKKSRKGRG